MNLTTSRHLHYETVRLSSLGDKISGHLYLPEEESFPCPAIIVCHGAGEFKENYNELAEFLRERGIAVLTLDMHGHGESEGRRFFVNIQQWIADIKAGISFLNSHPHIRNNRIGAFGLSSGGTAILELAATGQQLASAIVLSATVKNSNPWYITIVFQMLLVIGKLKKLLTKSELRIPLLKWLGSVRLVSDPKVEEELKCNPRNLEALMSFPIPGAEEAFFVNTIERVSKIKIPTMVIWGSEDQLDSPATATELYDTLTCKKVLHIIEGNGHAGHLDRNRHEVFTLTAEWALENLA